MSETTSIVVRMEWVADRLRQGDELVLADCRFALGSPSAGREAYEKGHLPGARFWDLEQDLSGPKSDHGGRHPMPDLGELVLKLGEAGIDEHTTVVVYDDQNGMMASRMWWLLRFLGSDRVYVMDGSYSKWAEAGYPVTDGTPGAREPKVFSAKVRSHLLVGMEEVREKLHKQGTVLIDSREGIRYLGETEPIDPVAGHIPGAVNRFWKDNMGDTGSWRRLEELRERFAFISPDEEIIVYCGSGVSACPNVLALAQTGRTDARLYLGSWSDWVSYKDNPVATGEE